MQVMTFSQLLSMIPRGKWAGILLSHSTQSRATIAALLHDETPLGSPFSAVLHQVSLALPRLLFNAVLGCWLVCILWVWPMNF